MDRIDDCNSRKRNFIDRELYSEDNHSKKNRIVKNVEKTKIADEVHKIARNVMESSDGPKIEDQEKLRIITSFAKDEKFKNELSYLNNLIKLDPYNCFHLASRARINRSLRNYDAALEDLNYVIEKQPDNNFALASRAATFFYQKKFTEADKDCHRALQLNEYNRLARVILSLIRDRDDSSFDEQDTSPFAFSEPFKGEKDYLQFNNNGNFDRRLSENQTKILSVESCNDTIFATLGEEEWKKKNFIMANYYLDKAIELNHRNDHAFAARGALFLEEVRFDRATEDINASLNINSKNELALLSKKILNLHREGIQKLKEHHHEEAMQMFTTILSIDPNNVQALASIAEMEMNKCDYDAALQNVERAIRLNPHEGALYFLRGRIHKNKNNIAESNDDFEKSIKFNYKFDLSSIYLGKNHLMSGNNKQAIDLFTVVINRYRMSDRATQLKNGYDLALAYRNEAYHKNI